MCRIMYDIVGDERNDFNVFFDIWRIEFAVDDVSRSGRVERRERAEHGQSDVFVGFVRESFGECWQGGFADRGDSGGGRTAHDGIVGFERGDDWGGMGCRQAHERKSLNGGSFLHW